MPIRTRRRRAAPALLLALAAAVGCAQYGRVRMEFDSATGFSTDAGEPDRNRPADEAVRWPWVVRQLEGTFLDELIALVFGLEPTARPLDEGGAFVRERMVGLTDLAIGDLGRMADAGRRLLWVAARSPQVLDQIVAIESLERLLAAMHVDPLEVPGLAADPAAAQQRVATELARLTALGPAGRGGRALSDLERRAYLAALRVVSERPHGNAAEGRHVLRTLLGLAVAEDDPLLRDGVRTALADVLACEMAQALRAKLGATGPYEVREAALLALRRRSGPRAVPYSLRVLAAARGTDRRVWDPSPDFRRTWIRLCAQLPRDLAFASYAGGPRPIEFLYDTAIADEEDGLRLLALGAMSRVLERPASFDRAWADAFWRRWSLTGETEGGQ